MPRKTSKRVTPPEPASASAPEPGAGSAERAEVEEEVPAEVAAAAAAEAEKVEEEPLQTQLLRLQADFDNFRKRTLREKAQVSERAIEGLLNELLPVVDHFEMGLATARRHEAEASVVEGFQLIYDQLMGVLQRFDLTALDAEGAVFDPHRHEAATYVPSDEHPEDTVIAQTRRGYMLGDRLLRATQVVVSSGTRAEDAATAANDAPASAEGSDGQEE